MEYSLEAFVDVLLKEKGMEGLSPEVSAQLKTDLLDRAEDYINAELLSAVPPELLGELENKIEDGNESEIQEFFQTHIPNLDELVANSLIAFRGLYINDGEA